MDRTARIVVGLALVGFAVYSGQLWAYIGVVPLLLLHQLNTPTFDVLVLFIDEADL